MKIGSESHKELFCQSFMASHRKYEPEHLPWPALDSTTLDRLRAIPFWDEALNTECKAGTMLSAYAATVNDPVLQAAIALQAMEESRHARLIATLIKRYDLTITERPLLRSSDLQEPHLSLRAPTKLPDNIEQAFIEFGYEECFDSFFAFGLFEIARQSGFVPEPLLTIFDPVLDEEARHILFFINWIAYQQVNQGRGSQVFQAVHSLWQYSRALNRRLNTFRSDSKNSGPGFTATGASAVTSDLTLEKFLSICLQENARRMSFYDDTLLRPQFLPAIASVVLRSLKLLPKRKPHSASSPSLG